MLHKYRIFSLAIFVQKAYSKIGKDKIKHKSGAFQSQTPRRVIKCKKKCPRGDCPSEVFLVFSIHAPQFPASLLDLRVDVGFLVRASHTLKLSPSHTTKPSRLFCGFVIAEPCFIGDQYCNTQSKFGIVGRHP
jgi:hypothetical protein